MTKEPTMPEDKAVLTKAIMKMALNDAEFLELLKKDPIKAIHQAMKSSQLSDVEKEKIKHLANKKFKVILEKDDECVLLLPSFLLEGKEIFKEHLKEISGGDCYWCS